MKSNKNKKNKNKLSNINKQKASNTENKNKDIDLEDKKIWKKIFIFSIIFFPYSLYLFLFKTKVSKYIKGIVVMIFMILSFFVFDAVKYPDRVHNEVVFKNIQSLKENDKIDLGKVYYVNKRDLFAYKDKEYISYILYDEMGMYYGIFDIVEYNKNYELVYLYNMMSDEIVDLKRDDFIKFSKIHPIVFVEMLKNKNISEFEEISKISQISDINIKNWFENTKYQEIYIGNRLFVSEFNDFGVISIKSKNGDIEYNTDVNSLLTLDFSSVYKVLSRNFGDKYKIVGYTYVDMNHIFNVLVGDTKYIVKYVYGEGASLQSIDNEDVYFESMKEIYEINNIKYE